MDEEIIQEIIEMNSHLEKSLMVLNDCNEDLSIKKTIKLLNSQTNRLEIKESILRLDINTYVEVRSNSWLKAFEKYTQKVITIQKDAEIKVYQKGSSVFLEYTKLIFRAMDVVCFYL